MESLTDNALLRIITKIKKDKANNTSGKVTITVTSGADAKGTDAPEEKKLRIIKVSVY